MPRAASAPYLIVVAAAAPFLLGACADSLDPPPERTTAYVLLSTQRNITDDGYVIRPTALFFRTNTVVLTSSADVPDGCDDRPWAERPETFVDTLPAVTYLDAGASVALETSGGAAATLVSTTDAFGKRYYAPAGNASVSPFTPGDVVTLTVPGGSGANAFPATTLSQTTVAPFGVDAVSPTSGALGLALSWTPPPVAPSGVVQSAMVASLLYRDAGTGTPNRELYCSMVDDGTFTVPRIQAGGWSDSDPTTHQVRFRRWRADVKLVGNAVTSVVSTFEVPTVSANQ